MSKMWLVAEHQFKKEVLKRGFLLAIVAMPFFLGFTAFMGWLTERMSQQTTAVGYVDPGQFLRTPPTGDDHLRFVPFASPAEARAALEAGEIAAYYVLPADYPQTRQAELMHNGQVSSEATEAFVRAVRANLLAGQPPEVATRALEGPRISMLAMDSRRAVPLDAPGLEQFLPLLVALLFAFWVMTVAATLVGAIADEKQNRTVEIIISSVSPGQMMAGKIVGVMGMALLLAASWVGLLLGFAWFGANVMGWEWLQDLRINGRDLALLSLVALPSFLCLAALMVALGSTVVDVQEGQQVGAVAFLVLFAPIYLVFLFATNPNSPLAIALSLFPLTSVTSLAARSIFMEVPTAQFVAAALVALVCGVALVWLAGKLFRANMLRYGQGLRLGRMVRRGA
ncbi:MAG: ABC transporter permease [Caldilineales bacterium]|nr:ABC transporter permease [Caldilineales bacterium]MDW8317490.1 ABC transporter permease [Anaerolineae bacterium]